VAQINRIRIDARRQLQEENICGSPSSFIEVVSKLTEVKSNMKTLRELLVSSARLLGLRYRAQNTSKPASAAIGESHSQQVRARCFYPKTAIVARL
jgi:hypothetical protein